MKTILASRLLRRTKGRVRRELIRRGLRKTGMPSWAIGMLSGPSPIEMHTSATSNPIFTAEDVTDIAADFVADPFALAIDGRWWLFFETYNRATLRGEIGVAKSDDLRSWTYEGIVLREPFHLSYPYVFAHASDIYLVPETGESSSVRLYRATDFPFRWRLDTILLEGGTFLDASLFQDYEKWWMAVETNPNHHYDTLCLYYASRLRGPWQPHNQNPIIFGADRARPGGRIVSWEGSRLRFGQDCSEFYGAAVRGYSITDLTPTSYTEHSVERAVLQGTGRGWNGTAMHHVDLHEAKPGDWIAFVDGY